MPNGSTKTKVIAPRTSDGSAPVPRNAYDQNGRVRKSFSGTGKTEQSHKKACDINSIMAKFQKTGAIQHLAKHPPRYGDVSGADFTAAQLLVAEHKTIFEELPSQIRAEFENDPAQYLTFVTDPENEAFLAKEGLAGLLPQEEPSVQETAAEAVSALPTEAPEESSP